MLLIIQRTNNQRCPLVLWRFFLYIHVHSDTKGVYLGVFQDFVNKKKGGCPVVYEDRNIILDGHPRTKFLNRRCGSHGARRKLYTDAYNIIIFLSILYYLYLQHQLPKTPIIIY